MAFQLRVEFTGLCLYLVHATPPGDRKPGDPLDAQKVTVARPDCRKGKVATRHADGDKGRPHAGYIRFDLANLTPGFPAGQVDDSPEYEVVHRFTRQTLDFGLPAAEGLMRVHAAVPEFEGFAPTLEPRPELSVDAQAGGLCVMKTTLTGGTLIGEPEPRDDWEFSPLFHPSGYSYIGEFAQSLV
ncbi:MAG TPA: hypothetical protein VGV85_08985, partial [Longimicrobiaceae bacterium]|nr:hypothetical protein [Longimicrobiaceae bacterium]